MPAHITADMLIQRVAGSGAPPRDNANLRSPTRDTRIVRPFVSEKYADAGLPKIIMSFLLPTNTFMVEVERGRSKSTVVCPPPDAVVESVRPLITPGRELLVISRRVAKHCRR